MPPYQYSWPITSFKRTLWSGTLEGAKAGARRLLPGLALLAAELAVAKDVLLDERTGERLVVVDKVAAREGDPVLLGDEAVAQFLVDERGGFGWETALGGDRGGQPMKYQVHGVAAAELPDSVGDLVADSSQHRLGEALGRGSTHAESLQQPRFTQVYLTGLTRKISVRNYCREGAFFFHLLTHKGSTVD